MTGTLAPFVAGNGVERNGVAVVRTTTGVGVASVSPDPPPYRPWRIEVDYYGRRLQEVFINPLNDLPWRDYYGAAVDHLALGVRVLDGGRVLAHLPPPAGADPLPFMVPRAVQVHVTESYVSCPPALTITDPTGSVWTLGFVAAPPELSPRGEFAFEVLRNGYGTGEIASRVEIRAGRVRAFTRHGWKNWGGREFL